MENTPRDTVPQKIPTAPVDIRYRKTARRAVEAAIWGMPLVSVDAMRRAFFNDAGAKYNDIVYLSKPADWKFRVTTPNASSYYAYFNFNLSEGPVVLEIPPAEGVGLFGSLDDAWEMPVLDLGLAGEDGGKGGKYLLMPPGFDRDISVDYIPAHFNTFNGYAALRIIPASRSEEDVRKAMELVRKIRVYPMAQAEEPPRQKFIDVAGKIFDGIVRFDDSFFDSLSRMINEEPILPRDMVMVEQLKSIGIEKGKKFNPDAMTREILAQAAEDAREEMMETSLEGTVYWPKTHWTQPSVEGFKTKFSYETEECLEYDARGSNFFLAWAASKKPGAAAFYLVTYRDAEGEHLMGERSYRLHIPSHPPASQYWAVTVYDLETAAFIMDAKKLAVDSYDDTVQKNPDGSIDVHFGSKPPKGRESNWIYTEPGRRWCVFMRFYGPEKPVFDKTWFMDDVQPVHG